MVKKVSSLVLGLVLCLGVVGEAYAQVQYPDPVVSVVASDGTSTTSVTVNWVPAPGGEPAVEYWVYRSETHDYCGEGSRITVVNAPTTEYIDLPPQTTKVYYYSVKAVAKSGDESIESNCEQSDFGWAGFAPAPLPPINLTATQSDYEKIRVSWQAPAGSQPIERYQLFRSTTQTFCSGTPFDVILEPNSTFDDTSAVPGQGYFYTMNSVGPTAELGGACTPVAALGYRVDPPPPWPPSQVRASDGLFGDKVEVVWQHPTAGGPITNYNLYRSDNPSALGCSSPLATGLPASQVAFSDTNVVPGRTYYYSIGSSGPGGASLCSPVDPGYAKIGSAPISATDGDFPDKVVVTWQPPAGGGDVSGYEVFKSENPSSCTGTLLGGQAFAPGTTSYTDKSVTPGQTYYYSVRVVSPNGYSSCSADPGFAVTACSDGQDNDADGKVDFPNDPGCSSLNDDNEVDPPVCSDGKDNDKDGKVDYPADPGCSSPEDGDEKDLPVCSDGLDNDGDGKVDYPEDPGCTSPLDENETDLPACSDGIDNDGDGLVDFPEDTGCESKDDDDEKSPEYVCDNGLDDDGDGKVDFKVNGSGDPGCDSPVDPSEDDMGAALKSPTFAKFNTFLGQWNFAELINQGSKDKEVTITLFNLYGQEMIQRTIVVPAASEVDVDVNSLLDFACDILKSGCDDFVDLSAVRGEENGLGRPDGIVDTYGLVRLEFDDSDPEQRLLGRISFYRPNTDGSFSFAFARELRNPSSGPAFALSNTYDPQALGYLVPNWAEVIAFGKRNADGELKLSQLDFTLNVYRRDGSLKDTREITLPALGEFDFHAGHEYVNDQGVVEQDVYLVEVVPHQENAEYLLTVSRYSSNSAPGTDPSTYNYAFALAGSSGTSETLFAPIGNAMLGVEGLKAKPIVINWVEVANVSDSAAQVTVRYRVASGAVIGEQKEYLAPKAQYHFNAGDLLPAQSSGVVEVESDALIVAQSMSYVHGASSGSLSGFSSPARTRGRSELVGTINTFLGMQNLLHVGSTSNEAVDAEFSIVSFRGESANGVLGFNSGASSLLSLSNNPTLAFPPDTYGALTLKTPSDGQALGSVYRVRLDAAGDVDFVMYTPVQ